MINHDCIYELINCRAGMKKIMAYLFLITLIVFIIDWGVVGIRILNHDYDITLRAYIGLVCVVLIFVCLFYRLLHRKCPHCGKPRQTEGAYCSYCGKKIS